MTTSAHQYSPKARNTVTSQTRRKKPIAALKRHHLMTFTNFLQQLL